MAFSGEYLLLVIDVYSHSLEWKSFILLLEEGLYKNSTAFSHSHYSDNGPPFFGEEFRAYMKENGIKQQVTLVEL